MIGPAARIIYAHSEEVHADRFWTGCNIFASADSGDAVLAIGRPKCRRRSMDPFGKIGVPATAKSLRSGNGQGLACSSPPLFSLFHSAGNLSAPSERNHHGRRNRIGQPEFAPLPAYEGATNPCTATRVCVEARGRGIGRDADERVGRHGAGPILDAVLVERRPATRPRWRG